MNNIFRLIPHYICLFIIHYEKKYVLNFKLNMPLLWVNVSEGNKIPPFSKTWLTISFNNYLSMRYYVVDHTFLKAWDCMTSKKRGKYNGRNPTCLNWGITSFLISLKTITNTMQTRYKLSHVKCKTEDCFFEYYCTNSYSSW